MQKEHAAVTAGEPEDGQLPDTNDARDQLLKEMKRAKGARFNASKRLERRDRRRTNVVAYASASVIVLTLLPTFFATPELLTKLLALATIAMSLIILAYSLLQGQANDPVKADQFHRCATEINELRRHLRAKIAVKPDELEKISKEYDSILRRYSINHDEEDYELYQQQHPDEFEDLTVRKKRVWIPSRFLSAIVFLVVTAAAIILSLAYSGALGWIRREL